MRVFIYLTMKTKDNLKQICAVLPFEIRVLVDGLPLGVREEIQEVRLRASRPVSICKPDGTFFFGFDGKLTPNSGVNLIKTSEKQLASVFSAICGYSVYSRQNEIKNGFVTLKGGNRAGICGTAIQSENGIINIRDITSINLRVAGERINCSKPLLENISHPEKGVLICGAPCSGKTTVLRDFARSLSLSRNLSVIDTRSELAAVYGGVCQNDIGLCDVLDGYPMREGFDHALRCLSPNIIVCDEIGNAEDVQAILRASKSGVGVIATAHCRDREELQSKNAVMVLLKERSFGTVVFLEERERAGQVKEIVSGDVFS